MDKPISIVLEGLGGSGKGTFARMLEDYFKNNNVPYVTTYEPGGTIIGDQIRQMLLFNHSIEGKISDQTEALLFAAARAQVLKEVVWPSLNEGKSIIMDRYVYSSYVYQQTLAGNSTVKAINDIATNGWHPDIVFLFDIPVDVAIQRVSGRDRKNNDRLDLRDKEYHEAARRAYLGLSAIYENFIILDATKSTEELIKIAINVIESFK